MVWAFQLKEDFVSSGKRLKRPWTFQSQLAGPLTSNGVMALQLMRISARVGFDGMRKERHNVGIVALRNRTKRQTAAPV